MKAISLWQPWATAIARNAKRIETRHWSTSYRGPLAIHAAKRKDRSELEFLHACWNWVGAMGWSWGGDGHRQIDELPFGAIVAVCDLVDVRPTGSFRGFDLDTPIIPDREAGHLYKWTERQMGNFEPGRFGWVLANIRPLSEPIPWVGRQSLFSVPDEVIAEALAREEAGEVA